MEHIKLFAVSLVAQAYCWWWNIMLCHWFSKSRDSEGMYCHHLQLPTAQAAFFMDCLTHKIQAVHSFATSGTTHPITQCHITEDLNPKLCSVVNLLMCAVNQCAVNVEHVTYCKYSNWSNIVQGYIYQCHIVFKSVGILWWNIVKMA
jgi:hypothetical protein